MVLVRIPSIAPEKPVGHCLMQKATQVRVAYADGTGFEPVPSTRDREMSVL
ncbi:MAG: hypothetical protein RLZZ28_2365 [Bacteroidota bacterium]